MAQHPDDDTAIARHHADVAERARQARERARAVVESAPRLAGEVSTVEGRVAATYRRLAGTAEEQGRQGDAERLRSKADHAERFAQQEADAAEDLADG